MRLETDAKENALDKESACIIKLCCTLYKKEKISVKKVKQISLFLTIILIISCAGFQKPAFAATVGDASITAAGAILMDFETGRVLYEHNADVFRPPASMTKLMTVYLVYEAISQGKIGFDTIVPISQNAADFSRAPGETNVPLNRSLRYTVDELLDVVIVMSAGGAAVALAELVGRSTSAFYRMMNGKAAEWGIDAVFTAHPAVRHIPA